LVKEYGGRTVVFRVPTEANVNGQQCGSELVMNGELDNLNEGV
jgi:hypothetical protein